jgi:hypothetical protein
MDIMHALVLTRKSRKNSAIGGGDIVTSSLPQLYDSNIILVLTLE